MLKNKLQLLSIVIFTNTLVFSQKPWEDLSITSINTEQAHASYIPYASIDEINSGKQSSFVLFLNGEWNFKYFENPFLVPDGFHNSNAIKNWDKISVPGNWQLQGDYDPPFFTNIKYPFEANPPFVPEDYNPTGIYKRSFSIPQNWKENEIFIHFAGVQSAMYLWINGKEVGYHEDAFLPAEFNITQYLTEKNNELVVQVLNYSDGTYVEDQDYWRLSGIFRNVFLFSIPQTHIRDFAVYSDLDKNFENAELNIKLNITNKNSKSAETWSVRFNFKDAGNKSLFYKKQTLKTIKKDSEIEFLFSEFISNPLKWTAETPNLYTLDLST